MAKLSSEFWDKQASAKTNFSDNLVSKTRFVADYFNNICFGLLKKFIGNFNCRTVLKTDLWNESVSTEREVLSYFKGSILYGTDISKIVCHSAYARNRTLFVSQGDVRSLPFKDGSFTAILDVSTIDHVSESDAVKVIAEYSRLLCKDGKLFLLYAQKMPFAEHYWNNAFDGVYLLDSRLINSCVAEELTLLDDRGLDFIHSLFGIGSKRLFERFLVWHCPSTIRKIVVATLFRLECSPLSALVKDYCGLRLNISVKRSHCIICGSDDLSSDPRLCKRCAEFDKRYHTTP